MYPDEITRKTAAAIADADSFRFDLSDLQPAEFGATEDRGSGRCSRTSFANPDDIDGAAEEMEDRLRPHSR